MIQIKQHELQDLLFCAFRYALGRKTYITSVIEELLLRYGVHLEKYQRQQMCAEITRAIDLDEAGMSCDIDSWKKVRKAFQGAG